MNTFAVALVALMATAAYARPQYRGQAASGAGPSIECRQQEVSAGVFKFTCVGVDPRAITISNEHILWLNAAGGQDQQLDIVVPNYRVEELIRAALKAGRGGSTNVNILLRKPETVYDVQADDSAKVGQEPPKVNLEYEGVPAPSSAHYPVDKPYNPLSGPIREP